MENLEPLAKSPDNGGLTLYEHTAHVLAAIEKFAADLGFDVEMARNGAILHDLGKAHPHFQNKIRNVGKFKSQFEIDEEKKVAHRHEISSLGFLPLFPKSNWDSLIDLVVAHHKSILGDPVQRGILDLRDNDRSFVEFHLKDWSDWSPAALEVARRFGVETRSISAGEAFEALQYAVAYCERKTRGWSPLKGLLRGADHFGSAFMHETEQVLQRTFKAPDLQWFHQPGRISDLYPLSSIPVDDPRAHTLVVASTGAGKTDFLMRRCRGRVFYTLPFQASINAMFERFKAVIPEADVRLLHAMSRLKVSGDSVEQTLQPLIGASVKVLTPHQIASIIFGTSGFETVMLDLKGTDVVLDEIHTYSEWSGAMVREIVRALLRLDCRIHIGTATIPTALYRDMLALLGGPDAVFEVKLPDEALDRFNRHVAHKTPNDPAVVEQILREAFATRERVLLVCNTVQSAQENYQHWKEQFPELPIMLIHSRFRRKDRLRLEHELKENYNDRKQPEYSPCLVISTQVVEVSLDISFDRMITDCAPLDALIQRFGRVNRVRSAATIGTYKPVHVLAPGGSALPYQAEVLRRSYEQLPDGALIAERSVQSMIDAVYPVVESKAIDTHLIYKEESGFDIKELTHRAKAIIVDVLEIESVTCILESDREAYEKGSWQTRPELEIPLAYSAIRRQASRYVQLQTGSWPYVIPQDEAEHEELGLVLHAPDKFI